MKIQISEDLIMMKRTLIFTYKKIKKELEINKKQFKEMEKIFNEFKGN